MDRRFKSPGALLGQWRVSEFPFNVLPALQGNAFFEL
jgi:hypothetical protein